MKNKAAYFGVFIALALIFSYVETWIPLPVGIPGVKLGLANLMTVIMLYKGTAREAFLLSFVRILLSGFLFGNLFGILYSLCGGIFSFLAMVFLKSRPGFSVVGVSIAGGVAHNIGQLLAAMIVVQIYQVEFYLPVLLLSGLLTGLLIGLAAREVLKRLKNLQFDKADDGGKK